MTGGAAPRALDCSSVKWFALVTICLRGSCQGLRSEEVGGPTRGSKGQGWVSRDSWLQPSCPECLPVAQSTSGNQGSVRRGLFCLANELIVGILIFFLVLLTVFIFISTSWSLDAYQQARFLSFSAWWTLPGCCPAPPSPWCLCPLLEGPWEAPQIPVQSWRVCVGTV